MYNKNYNYLFLANEYFQLVLFVLKKIKYYENGNAVIGFSYNENKIDDLVLNQLRENQKKELNDMSKVRFSHIGTPLFFNFYHGIELTLKGIYYSNGGDRQNTIYLKGLIDKVRLLRDSKTLELISRYLNKEDIKISFLKAYFEKINRNPSDFYQIFKYPGNDMKLDIDFINGIMEGNEDEYDNLGENLLLKDTSLLIDDINFLIVENISFIRNQEACSKL